MALSRSIGGIELKVLIAVNELNIRGGTHKQVLRLCEYLSKENEVVIYTRIYEKEKTYPEFKKFKIVTLDVEKKGQHNNIISKIIRKIKKKRIEYKVFSELVKKVDIVNIHDCGLANLVKIVKKENKKVVLQINDMPRYFLEGNAKGQKDNWKNKIKRLRFQRLIKKIDEITVNVSKNKEVVKKRLKRDSNVFYCGVDINKKLERHHSIYNKDRLNLFSSGVFFPYRNYETLIKVVEKIVKNNIQVHLDIMGSTEWDKEYSDSIKKMIIEMNLERYITIWGQVDEKKYVELHNIADMFIFININQSWGLAVFEAMSYGLPVVVSESVGAIELLKNKENAIIVDPENVDEIYNEIINLKNNKKYYEKISNNAYKIVKDFTWDKLYSSKMLELFEKLVKE